MEVLRNCHRVLDRLLTINSCRILAATYPVTSCQNTASVTHYTHSATRCRHLHTSQQSWFFKDIRPKDHDERSKELIIKQGTYFNEAAKVAKNKATYKKAVRAYLKRQGVYYRGHVEFIYAAMNHMEQFDAHTVNLFALFPFLTI